MAIERPGRAPRRWTTITIGFRTPETRERLIAELGPAWEKHVRSSLWGQPDGLWEVVDARDVGDLEQLGCIPVFEPEESGVGWFFLMPVAGHCRGKYLEDVPGQLVNHIVNRILEIFGPDGMEGTTEEYAWLAENYGITEEYDNKWLDILGYYKGDLHEQPSWATLTGEERQEITAFVTDQELHLTFLFDLARRYASGKPRYRKRHRR
jgi:hypothetical protein